jgi:putative flippase GtrA
MRRLISFAVVGGTGFIVDAGVLTTLLEFRLTDKFSARVAAIGLALLVTWTLNRRFTFEASDRHVAVEGMRYGTVGIVGNLINFGVYSSILILFPHVEPLIALILGSATGTIFAYTGYSKLVFRR